MNRTERQERIRERRQAQPIAELERKYKKCLGRNHKAYWQAEEIDFAVAQANELHASIHWK